MKKLASVFAVVLLMGSMLVSCNKDDDFNDLTPENPIENEKPTNPVEPVPDPMN